MFVAIVSFPGFDIINFEINVILLVKFFSNLRKKSRQKSKYHENEKNFEGEVKKFVFQFKGFQLPKIRLGPDSAPLAYYFSIHPFSTPWKQQKSEMIWCSLGVKKGCIKNKWVKGIVNNLVTPFKDVFRTLLTFSWRRSLSYGNQSTDLLCMKGPPSWES